MNQLFNITIGGDIVTIETCNISLAMNRMYDVATFNMSELPQHELDVVINYGDKTFNGFVYSTQKISKLLYKIECRTYGAKLTEPYSAFTEGFDDATTSHELCALYASQADIPINITSENIDFGGSYERTGTMLSGLRNIASVTGAEYWDDGLTIQIQPNKEILDIGTEVPPSVIFDFIATKTSVYNKGVGFITIRNGGSETSDIISKNSVYAEVDECTGEIFVFPNPYGEIEHTVGMSPLTEVQLDRLETYRMLDDDTITLNGAINSVTSLTLNGVEISDYEFEVGHNVIYFNTLKRGTVTIDYTALGYRGFTNISTTPIGRFITFDIIYLDQYIKFEGFLSPDCANTESTDGDMTCIVPSDRPYNYGFDAWTIGGNPEIIFYNGSDVIVRNVVSEVADYSNVESATLEATDGGYRYQTRYTLKDALGARSGDDDIDYTLSSDEDGDYFEFTQYYPQVEVSYTTDAIKHHIEFPEILHGIITMLIRNENTDQACEYLLNTQIPCELNQYIAVDIIGELGIDLPQAIGRSLPYTRPNNSEAYATVNSFGGVKIWVATDGDYVIDTSSLKPRTTITLVAQVNG